MESTLKLLENDKLYRDALLKMIDERRADMTLEMWASYYTAAFFAQKRIDKLEAVCAAWIVEKEFLSLNQNKIAA